MLDIAFEKRYTARGTRATAGQPHGTYGCYLRPNGRMTIWKVSALRSFIESLKPVMDDSAKRDFESHAQTSLQRGGNRQAPNYPNPSKNFAQQSNEELKGPF